jgi:hypothetical protein
MLTEEQKTLLHDIYYNQGFKFGRDKIWFKIKTEYPDMTISRDAIGEWLKLQEINQLLAQKPSQVKEIKRTVLNEPFAVVGIDLLDMSTKAVTVEGKTYRWLLNGVDLFSKRLYSVALSTKDQFDVLQGFKYLLSQMTQPPRSIRCDNDSSFTSDIFKKFTDEKGIKVIYSSPSKPQSNGAIERVNGVLKQLLARNMIYADDNNWVSLLPQALYNYNSSFHRIIKMTPYDAENANKSKVKENIIESVKPKNESLENFNRPVFEIGDSVRIRLDEFGLKKNIGSLNFSRELYTIHKIVVPRLSTSGAIYYQVKDVKGNVVSKNYYKEQLLHVKGVENPIKEPVKYIINKIMGETVENGTRYLLIKWKYYPAKKDWTYEKYDQIKNDTPKLVDQYERNKKLN